MVNFRPLKPESLYMVADKEDAPQAFPDYFAVLNLFSCFAIAMASGSAKFHVVVSGNNSVVTFAQQFDLDDAITMPENPQARQQAVSLLVSDMPTVKYATGNCSVCMESFGQSVEAARQVSCGHVYHHNCITNWLSNGNSNSCPLCRHEISG